MIPVGVQNTLGFEFTNVVVKPARLVPIKSVGLTGLQIDTGIQLEARNLPVRCVAIQFLRWNLTTHESAYSTVSSDVGFIDPASRAADLITTIDSNVTQGNIYRYVARLIYVDGSYEDAGSVIMEFVTPAPGRVNTSITNLSVSGSIPDVSFTINTVINNTSLDAIKQMLGSQDLQQYFQGDIQNQRDQLANLIAHSVQRVDLMTGVRESFGTLTTSLFVDSTLGKSNAVSPLQYGHTYRYEIYPLLRAPETMFDGLVKQSVDGTTKKAFSFSPAKFLHPLALNQGVIATTAGAGQRYAKDPMSFGVVGDITTVEASFDNATALIIDQTASPFNRSLNIVTWQVQGDITQVDHFIIMKLVNGVMTLLGKAHSEFPYGVCQYFHPLTNHDNGSLSYVIVPVMNDYQVGPSATTNPVIVDVP